MDLLGSILFSSSFILIVFAITDGAHSTWQAPYIGLTLDIGVALLGLGLYTEAYIFAEPLLPLSLFAVPQMKALFLALFFSHGSLGIYLLYATFYSTDILHATALQLVAWCTPLALGGIIVSTIGGLFLHKIPGTFLLLFAGIAWILEPLLFAIAPIGATYWPWIFPSMICATLGTDITFNVTTIFITTSLPSKQ